MVKFKEKKGGKEQTLKRIGKKGRKGRERRRKGGEGK